MREAERDGGERLAAMTIDVRSGAGSFAYIWPTRLFIIWISIDKIQARGANKLL